MAFIDKAALLSPPPLKRHRVTIESMGGEIVLRELTVGERLERKKLFKPEESDERALFLSVLCMVTSSLCNEDDSEMFEQSEWQQAAEAIMARSNAEAQELVEAWQKIQGLEDEEEAVKNSDASPSDSSSSGSPETSDSPQPVLLESA